MGKVSQSRGGRLWALVAIPVSIIIHAANRIENVHLIVIILTLTFLTLRMQYGVGSLHTAAAGAWPHPIM